MQIKNSTEIVVNKKENTALQSNSKLYMTFKTKEYLMFSTYLISTLVDPPVPIPHELLLKQSSIVSYSEQIVQSSSRSKFVHVWFGSMTILTWISSNSGLLPVVQEIFRLKINIIQSLIFLGERGRKKTYLHSDWMYRTQESKVVILRRIPNKREWFI